MANTFVAHDEVRRARAGVFAFEVAAGRGSVCRATFASVARPRAS
jgi:hypothetical protein